jgi:hypothetical protein
MAVADTVIHFTSDNTRMKSLSIQSPSGLTLPVFAIFGAALALKTADLSFSRFILASKRAYSLLILWLKWQRAWPRPR